MSLSVTQALILSLLPYLMHWEVPSAVLNTCSLILDLSAVDAEVLQAKGALKMDWVCLQNFSGTPHHATALFTAVGEDVRKLRVLDLNANDLSSVQPSSFIPPLQVLKGFYLNDTNLKT